MLDADRAALASARADALRLSGRPAEAVALLAPVLGRDPDHEGLLLAMAAALLDIPGRYGEGLRYAERAAQLGPDNAVAWRTVATAHLRIRDLRGARGPARRAVELAPNEWESHVLVALSLVRDTLTHRDAVAAAERAQSLNPLEPWVYIVSAQALVKQGRRPPAADVRQAEQYLREALRLDPTHAGAQLELASLPVAREVHSAAVRPLLRLLSQRPIDRTTLESVVHTMMSFFSGQYAVVAAGAVLAAPFALRDEWAWRLVGSALSIVTVALVLVRVRGLHRALGPQWRPAWARARTLDPIGVAQAGLLVPSMAALLVAWTVGPPASLIIVLCALGGPALGILLEPARQTRTRRGLKGPGRPPG